VLEEAEGVRLSSVVYPSIWPLRRELVAVCRRRHRLHRRFTAEPTHAAPTERCLCGIYGASHPSQLLRYLESDQAEARASRRLLGRVPGRVLLWGTVVESKQGWRASHAYPERIYVRSGAQDSPLLDGEQLARALATYGVPVELLACETLADLTEALVHESEFA
jgi:hypothetical protein